MLYISNVVLVGIKLSFSSLKKDFKSLAKKSNGECSGSDCLLWNKSSEIARGKKSSNNVKIKLDWFRKWAMQNNFILIKLWVRVDNSSEKNKILFGTKVTSNLLIGYVAVSCCETFISVNSLSRHTIIVTILQVRKLREREVKQLS